jgi:hypothetical protein
MGSVVMLAVPATFVASIVYVPSNVQPVGKAILFYLLVIGYINHITKLFTTLNALQIEPAPILIKEMFVRRITLPTNKSNGKFNTFFRQFLVG